MSARLRVPGRVPVRRVVTAMSPTALLTRSQMDPFVAGLDTLVALVPPRLFDGFNRTQVFTLFGRHTALDDAHKSKGKGALLLRIAVAS